MSMRTKLGCLTGAAALLALMIVGGLWARDRREIHQRDSRQALVAMTREGDEVIGATKKFVSNFGRPPSSIDDLVPEYLPAIPAARAGWAPWEVLPKDPGGTDVREFAIRRMIVDPSLRSKLGYEQLSCYVDPKGRQNWYARSGKGFSSHDTYLRRAEEP